MKRRFINVVAAGSVLLSSSVFAIASNEKWLDPELEFSGTITKSDVVNRTCIVKGVRDGGLETNSNMTVLSTLAPGGTPGIVKVTVGNIWVNLTTSDNSLTRSSDRDESDAVAVENVELLSGIGNVNGDTAAQIVEGTVQNTDEINNRQALDKYIKKVPVRQESSTSHEIHFMASMTGIGDDETRNGIFGVGFYKGQTTVTCEPR